MKSISETVAANPEHSSAIARQRYESFAAKFPPALAAKEEKAVERFRGHRRNSVTKLKDLKALADELMRPAGECGSDHPTMRVRTS